MPDDGQTVRRIEDVGAFVTKPDTFPKRHVAVPIGPLDRASYCLLACGHRPETDIDFDDVVEVDELPDDMCSHCADGIHVSFLKGQGRI